MGEDAECGAFTTVRSGKQPTDEARKKIKEKRKERTWHDKTETKKVVRSVGVYIYILHITNTKIILIFTIGQTRPKECDSKNMRMSYHCVGLDEKGTPVSEFSHTSKKAVDLIDDDPSNRSLFVIPKTACLDPQTSASNFNGCLFCGVTADRA